MNGKVVIQDPKVNPIINSPYDEPKYHWELDERGSAKSNRLPGRREARGTNPTPQPKANTIQPMLVGQDIESDVMVVLRFL